MSPPRRLRHSSFSHSKSRANLSPTKETSPTTRPYTPRPTGLRNRPRKIRGPEKYPLANRPIQIQKPHQEEGGSIGPDHREGPPPPTP